MPKLQRTSDSDDDNDKGAGVSSTHSLASDMTRQGRRKPRKGTAVSLAGSNAQSSRAAARIKISKEIVQATHQLLLMSQWR